MSLRMPLAVLASLATIGLARAQPAPGTTPGTPVRINATIMTASPGTMRVRQDDGATVTILLPPGTRYGTQVERSLSDIKPGEFVGSAAMRGRDGRLHAQEVHIFPESMRGTGEGHRPMDLPEQTMTNAAVQGVAEAAVVQSAAGAAVVQSAARAAAGRVLTLRYPGGEQQIEVGPDVRVVGLLPGDASLLVPGAAVTVRATRAADGSITAIAVQAEKDGVKPLP